MPAGPYMKGFRLAGGRRAPIRLKRAGARHAAGSRRLAEVWCRATTQPRTVQPVERSCSQRPMATAASSCGYPQKASAPARDAAR